jgi:hypothetical protein
MLIGFRTMELSERLLMEDVASPNNFYEADTHNHLYGLQAGAIVTPLQWGRFRMDAGLKAGALVNIADSRAHDSVIFVFPSDRGNDLAFFGEASITAVYQATDHIGLRMGYQMAALDGVALAPDQVATHLLLGPDAGTANIALGGTVLYQGGFAGLELTW